MLDPISQLRDAMHANGLNAPEHIEPGKIQRIPGAVKSASNKAGWCKVFDDGTPFPLSASIETALLNGRRVRALDHEPELRPAFWAAITGLMDCLQIIQRWETIGERHLAGTRLRARVFYIPADGRKGLHGRAAS